MNKKYYIISMILTTQIQANKQWQKENQDHIDLQAQKEFIDEPKNWHEILDENPYHYNYEQDDANFKEGTLHKFWGTAKRDLIFVNFHGSAPLGPGGRGQRTLSWVIPYECALHHSFFTRQNSHNKLALLKSWSEHGMRPFVSFLIIPEGTRMKFKIGVAGEQKDKYDQRSGGGIQIRLADLPKNTLVLKTLLAAPKKNGKESFDLPQKLQEAVKKYEQENGEKVPNISYIPAVSCLDIKTYLEASFAKKTRTLKSPNESER